MPVKRTALGRTKHEAANTWLAPDGRVVVYSGDDERFQCLYKFVTDGTYDENDRAKNLTLLDSGTLYVARLDGDGNGTWIPMVYAGNETALNAAGITGQGAICVHTRQAAAALGGTKMDRPEDVEVNPVNGAVYMACTNNTNRGTGSNPVADAPNPRNANKHGHIIEIVEAGNDHAATTFTWDVFMLCGHGENACQPRGRARRRHAGGGDLLRRLDGGVDADLLPGQPRLRPGRQHDRRHRRHAGHGRRQRRRVRRPDIRRLPGSPRATRRSARRRRVDRAVPVARRPHPAGRRCSTRAREATCRAVWTTTC